MIRLYAMIVANPIIDPRVVVPSSARLNGATFVATSHAASSTLNRSP
jgi:hypothetical protein